MCVALTACSICGRARTSRLDLAELGRRLPRTAKAQLAIPSLRRLAEKLTRLEALKAASFAAQLQGFNDASEYAAALATQIGVDLRSPSEMAKIGIDPDQGAGAALLSDGSVLVVLAAQDAAKLRDAVASFARNHWGAVTEGSASAGGQSWQTFARAGASRNQISLAVDRGIASIILDAQVPELAFFGPSPKTSRWLAEDVSWVDAMKGLADADAYLRISGDWQIGSLLLSTATLALDFNRQLVRLRGIAPLAQENTRALEKQQADALAGWLPDDAILMARFAGQPQDLELLLGPVWTAKLEDAFATAGIDFRVEVLGNLRPGAFASLSLAPTAVLSSVPVLDLRRTNPFRFVHLVAIGTVKNSAQANEVLRRIPGAAPKFGVQFSEKELAARKVFVTSYAQGEGLDFGLIDDKVVVASPLKRLEDTLHQLSLAVPRQPSPFRSELAPYLQRGALDAVLDVNRLSESVRSLPGTAWGVGGFAIKAAMLRWLAALDDVRALTFTAAVSRTPQALELELDLLLTGT